MKSISHNPGARFFFICITCSFGHHIIFRLCCRLAGRLPGSERKCYNYFPRKNFKRFGPDEHFEKAKLFCINIFFSNFQVNSVLFMLWLRISSLNSAVELLNVPHHPAEMHRTDYRFVTGFQAGNRQRELSKVTLPESVSNSRRIRVCI